MATVPEAYYEFVTDYTPYAYIVPPDTPDPEWGRTAFAAAFAIEFLYEAYFAKQFEERKTAIYDKVVSLADWILTQLSLKEGALRKRLISLHGVYPTHQEFEEKMRRLDEESLAKALKRLSFLMQTKVYLFWSKI